METDMKKITAILFVLILCVALAGADDFKYNVKTDDTLKKAQTNFHKVMGALWHGPLENKKTDAVAEKLPELLKFRDEIMKANLPEEFAHNLKPISKTAVKFSAAVDTLAKTVKAEGSSEDIYNAFSKMHDYYRDLKTMTLALNDVSGKFHDVMHPLVHEAYEKKDTKAIADGADDLLKWAKLILQVNTGKPGEIEAASKELVKACEELKKVCEGKDAKAILEGLSNVHDAYHMISEEPEHE
jgi:ribosome-associated translation inhibitor RaiA